MKAAAAECAFLSIVQQLCQVFLGYLWNPLSWAMEVAAIIAIALLDYADFALIVALLILNATISFVEESNADKAIKALAAALAPKAKALRDGKQSTLCPGMSSLSALVTYCLRTSRSCQRRAVAAARKFPCRCVNRGLRVVL
jgi:hypothetical protein